jgi:hypothetical protein
MHNDAQLLWIVTTTTPRILSRHFSFVGATQLPNLCAFRENKLKMEESCNFGDSCLTLALNKSLHFLSAFPTKIVFGKCSPLGFLMSQCFQFQLNELFKLYFAIFEIVKYFALNNTVFEKKLILSKFEQNYFVVGKVLWINNEEKKVGVFGIEQLSEEQNGVCYELYFTDVELNDFTYALLKVIPSALCLKSRELLLFQKVAQESTKTIKCLRIEKNCEQFVKQFLKEISKEICEVSIYNLSSFLNYYCEIILIFHKFQTLFNAEIRFDNIDIIISKIE